MKNNKYEFAVLVDGKYIKEYEHGADTYIEGRKGSTYELYFKNNTSNRVEVIFSVDGLSIMDGKTASDKSEGYIVNAYNSIKVPGWKINSQKVAQFQFQPQNDKANTTYVELLAEEGFNVDTGNQGVIGCLVFVEKEKQIQAYPYYPYYPPFSRPRNPWYFDNLNPVYIGDSISYGGVAGVASAGANPLSQQTYNTMTSASLSKGSITRSVGQNNIQITASSAMEETSMGTSFGNDKKFETVMVEFERNSNHDWISVINYDTIQGLRKRGVLFFNSPKAKAFPKFKDEGCPIPSRR